MIHPLHRSDSLPLIHTIHFAVQIKNPNFATFPRIYHIPVKKCVLKEEWKMPGRIFWYLFRNLMCIFSQCFNARTQSCAAQGKEQHGRGSRQDKRDPAAQAGGQRCREPRAVSEAAPSGAEPREPPAIPGECTGSPGPGARPVRAGLNPGNGRRSPGSARGAPGAPWRWTGTAPGPRPERIRGPADTRDSGLRAEQRPEGGSRDPWITDPAVPGTRGAIASLLSHGRQVSGRFLHGPG